MSTNNRMKNIILNFFIENQEAAKDISFDVYDHEMAFRSIIIKNDEIEIVGDGANSYLNKETYHLFACGLICSLKQILNEMGFDIA